MYSEYDSLHDISFVFLIIFFSIEEIYPPSAILLTSQLLDSRRLFKKGEKKTHVTPLLKTIDILFFAPLEFLFFELLITIDIVVHTRGSKELEGVEKMNSSPFPSFRPSFITN